MVKCSGPGCPIRTKDRLRMFRFPRQRDRQEAWISKVGHRGNWIPTENARLCEVRDDWVNHVEHLPLLKEHTSFQHTIIPNPHPWLFIPCMESFDSLLTHFRHIPKI